MLELWRPQTTAPGGVKKNYCGGGDGIPLAADSGVGDSAPKRSTIGRRGKMEWSEPDCPWNLCRISGKEVSAELIK